jgi:microcystin-dependent protein
MAEPFLSEIRMMSFNFAPRGWALCDGQTMPINQNQALFSLLGTTYGGNGTTNFLLPDLRARVPIHSGAGHTIGERAGAAAHTLTPSEMPAHSHALSASTNAATVSVPTGNVLAAVNNGYTASANLVGMAAGELTNTGGSQPHENRQPFLTINFCIALQGIFPSPT